MQVSEVTAKFPDLDVRLVRNTMLRLAAGGRIERLGRGEYRLKAGS